MFSKISRPRPRTAVAVVGAAVAAASLVACGGSGSSASSGAGKDFSIGLVTPSTGPLAANGQGNKAGFEFYWKQHNYQAGQRHIALSEADEGTTAQAVANTQGLVTQQHVDLVAGFVSSASALAARDVTERGKVPLVVIQAASTKLSDGSDSSPLNAQLGAPFEQTFAAITKYALTKGAKHIVFLGSDYAAGHDAGGAVEQTAKAGGAAVVKSIYAPLGTQDFGPFLGNIPKNADAAIVFFAGDDATRFVQQYDQFGLKAKLPLYAHWSLTVDPLLAQEGKPALGIATVQEYASTIGNAANKKFVTAWSAAHGGTPPNAWNAQGYIAAQAIATALDDTKGTASGEQLGQAIRAVKMVTPLGPVSFTPDGGIVEPLSYAVVQAPASGAGLVNAVVSSAGTTGAAG